MPTSRVVAASAALIALCLVAPPSPAQSGNFAAILDNGEPGTSSSGATWKISVAPNPYGVDSLYTSRAGATYTYRVTLPQSGAYEVYLWWTRASSRDPDVPVVVAHAGGSSTVFVNQTQNGGQWNRIGSWTFGTTGTITLQSQGSELTVSADAVGFIALGGAANQPPQAFIDSIDPTAATVGQAIEFRGHGSDADGAITGYRWWSSIDGVLSSAASFSSSALSVGSHSIVFNVQDDDGAWSGDDESVVRVDPLLESPVEVIRDNGQPGTSSAGGTWNISGGSNPYGADSLYTSKVGATYSYQISLPQPGQYNIHLWWTRTSNRRTDVPVEIVHALGTSTVTVNQLENGGKWNLIGTWSFSASAKITIRSLGDGTTCADAVRLASGPTGNQPPVAVIRSISPNPAPQGSSVSFSGEGTDVDGSVVAHAWTSSLQGSLSGAASFTKTNLVAGTHTIGLRVRDDAGAWSAEARSQLQINASQGGGAGGFLTGVKAVPISPTVAEVRFDTTERMLATVVPATSGAFTQVSDPDYRTYHSLYLRGLQPNRNYALRIQLLARGGATYTSSQYTFSTQDNQDYSVRSDRPRLLLRPEDISPLRSRIQGDLHTEWTQTVSGCDKLLAKTNAEIYAEGTHHYSYDAPALCLCYLLTGDQEYADKAIDLARYVIQLDLEPRDATTKGIPIVAPIYDSLYNNMSSTLRQSLGRDLYRLTKSVYDDQSLDIENIEGHTVEDQPALIYGSLAAYNSSDSATVQLFRDVLRNYFYRFLPAKRFFMGDGGSSSGWWYAAYSRDFPYLLANMVLENASVEPLDLFEQESSWLSNYSRWYLYGLRGDRTFVRRSDTSPVYDFQHRNYLALRMLAVRLRDGEAQWLASYLHESTRTGTYGSTVLKKAQYAYELLLHDKTVAAEAPSLPLARWFRKPGVVILRESWEPETVIATFVSAPYFTGGHQHLDDLSISLYYKGGLAVDGGMYDEFGSAHHRNYYRRTLAHNSITVFDPDERFCNPIGDGNFDCTGPARLANDGGQRIQEIVPGFDYIPRNVDDLVHPQTPFDRGGVVIYEDTTEYTYALGRGGPSYQSAKVAVADRHFLWLKSVRDLRHPLVVVFDNVEGKDRDHVKAYHLHARNTVSVAGTTITATNENRITGEEGVLYDTVLLPRNPRITVRTGDAVFRVDGDVYAPEERADETTASILELERSRVEVCPPTQNLVDQFLNVLYVTDAGGENRPSSSLVNAQGMYGLAVKDWIVLFAPRELSREGTTYSASGPASHLLIGMKDDVEFDILVDGNLRVTTRSSSEGTLRFDLSSGGDVEVRRG